MAITMEAPKRMFGNYTYRCPFICVISGTWFKWIFDAPSPANTANTTTTGTTNTAHNIRENWQQKL